MLYNEVNEKLSTIAAKHDVRLTPGLRLLDNGNIQKEYRLTGSRWNCGQLIADADILNYTDHGENSYEIAQACAQYEPEKEEAEVIDAALESDKDWDDILKILVGIVKEYDFDEESYYIDAAYSPNGDRFCDIFESFNELSDFESWIDEFIDEELYVYTQNVYENFRSAKEVEELNLLSELADWANDLLKIAGSPYYYDSDEWTRDLVEAWKKTDEVTY